VEDAGPPTRDVLPDEIKGVAARQAIELSNERWNYDVGRLVLALDEALGRAPPRGTDRGHTGRSRRGWILGVVAGVVILAAVGVAGWLASRPSGNDGGGTAAAAWCQGTAPLCGRFRVDLTLPHFDDTGFFPGLNNLWDEPEPHDGLEWDAQTWTFGNPGTGDWRIEGMENRDGALTPVGTYVDAGKGTCPDGNSEVIRTLTISTPPTSPNDGFAGTLDITWQCPGADRFNATLNVQGQRTG